MSFQAMRWATFLPLTRAGGGARAVLMLLAERADAEGRAAFPSARTMAQTLGVTERSVRRYLVELEDAALIRRGDQRRAEHLRADRRPTVWDLPAAPVDSEPDGVTALSGREAHGVTALSGREAHGVTELASRGDRSGRHGVTAAVLENRPLNRPEPPYAPAHTHAPAREETTGGGEDLPRDDSPAAQLVRRCLEGMDRETRRRVAPGWASRCQPAAAALLVAGWSAGDVVREVGRGGWGAGVHTPGRLLQYRLQELAQVPSSTQVAEDAKAARPEWCGECDSETTRHRETPSGAMARCPRCHPLGPAGLVEAMAL